MLDLMSRFLLLISTMRRNASTPIAIDSPKNSNLHHPTSFLSPDPCLLRHRIHLPISLPLLCHFPHIYTTVIFLWSSPSPSLSAILIILYLYRTSDFILPRIYCGPCCSIFYCPVYSDNVIYLPYRIRYSILSVFLSTTLFDLLCPKLFLSLSENILSLQFFLLSWHGSYFYLWCSCSAPIYHVFHRFHSLCSALIWSLASYLYPPIYLIHLWSAQLWLLWSHWISLLRNSL